MTNSPIQYKIYESLTKVKENLGLHLDVFENYKKVNEHFDVFQETYKNLFQFVNDTCRDIEGGNTKQKIKFGINLDSPDFNQKNIVVGYLVTEFALSIARFYAENSTGGGLHNNILSVLDKRKFFEYESDINKINNELKHFHIIITYLSDTSDFTKGERQKYMNIVNQMFSSRLNHGIDIIYYKNENAEEIPKNITIV